MSFTGDQVRGAQRRAANKTARSGSRQVYDVGVAGTLVVDVEYASVEGMLQALELAVSGPSLEWWLDNKAHPYFQEDIVMRFAYEGDRKSGAWPPLSEATHRIRESLGYTPDDINRRSNQLLEFVAEDYDTFSTPDMAVMNVPGNAPNALTAKKLETAQKGDDNNPMGFGPTPPRPVLADPDSVDMAYLLESLMFHISDMVLGGGLSGAGQVIGAIMGAP